MRSSHFIKKSLHRPGVSGLIVFSMLLFISTPVFAARYGLIVGSDYKGNAAGIPPLDLCEKDAQLMKSTLVSQGSFKDAEILLGKMVTASKLEAAIDRLADKVSDKDTVVLYFSGHGTTQRDTSAPDNMRNYIVMYDRPHVPDDTLNDWVSRIKTPRLAWVFDCCYSGGIARKGRKTRGEGVIPVSANNGGTVIENGNKKAAEYFENKAIVASSSANETSIEVRGNINHGLFTYYFTKGFSPSNSDLNKDGSVTIYEAFEWSQKRVTQEAKKYNHNQHPQISGNAAGIIIAGKTDPTPPNPDPNPDVVNPNPNPPQPGPEVDDDNSITEDTTEDIEEPEVVVHEETGKVMILTTIFMDTMAGPTSMDPTKLIDTRTPLERLKNKENTALQNKTRSVIVKASGNEYPTKVTWVNEAQLRAYSGEQIKLGWWVDKRRGIKHLNKVAKLDVTGIPTGVHEIEIVADGYPRIIRRLAVEEDNSKNKLFVLASLSGYGSIEGKVFLQNFETPLAGQKVWMPIVRTTNQKHTAITKSDGSFWFLNLPPGGGYMIRPSILENLDNNNITVEQGKTTTVDVVLNRRMSK
ncbi:MAG: caspase family protein [Leptospiraceae bacterium]|nr:caspase family protein [Leptospiraceae bacterium]